jgi:hypothetical protein
VTVVVTVVVAVAVDVVAVVERPKYAESYCADTFAGN